MENYYAVQLSSCVKGELILLKADVSYLYAHLFTDEQFQAYKKWKRQGIHFPMEMPIDLNAPCDGDFWLVVDNGGDNIDNIKCTFRRFAPGISKSDAIGMGRYSFETYVVNADDILTEGSMIQYWKENHEPKSQIDLSKQTFICPSCGKVVSTARVHGAHVRSCEDTSALYITPTCDSCNSSKVKRYFKVNKVDFVEAPKNQ